MKILAELKCVLTLIEVLMEFTGGHLIHRLLLWGPYVAWSWPAVSPHQNCRDTRDGN